MKAILVLGTGRSGTSALAGCLQILGGFCGCNLRSGTTENAKGYFEDKNIITLSNYLLQQAGTPWYSNSIPISSIKMVDPTKERIELCKYAIHIAYSNNPVIVIKDPRMCLLFFCYYNALMMMGYEVYHVISNRQTSEKIKSVLSASSLTENEAENLVHEYDRQLNSCQIVSDNIIVHYSDLLSNTDKILTDFKEYLPFLNYEEPNIRLVKNFLDPSLKHF